MVIGGIPARITTTQPYGGNSARPDATGQQTPESKEGAKQGERAEVGGSSQAASSGEEVLTNSELRKVEALQRIDREVRAHEMAHVAAGGRYVRSGARFQYKRGPDGQNYAVAGEVSIDTSAVPNDPAATAEKMDVVRRAALAPMDPSPQDLRVAARASQLRSEALMELALLQVRETLMAGEEEAGTWAREGAAAYAASGDENIRGTLIHVAG